MPTYEYECEACNKHFEVFQKMSEAPLSECPDCKGHVHRVLSAGIGISFQGSGFYVNDSHGSCKGSCPAGAGCKS